MRVPTPPPLSTLTEMLQFRASHDPDKVAFAYLCDGETVSAELTYRQLDRRASAIGAWLQERGAAGKRVLLEYPYSLDFVSGFFGCLYAGAVAVPVNPPMSDRQLPRLASIVSDAEAAFVLSTSALIDQIKARFEQVSAVPTLEWCASDLWSASRSSHATDTPDTRPRQCCLLRDRRQGARSADSPQNNCRCSRPRNRRRALQSRPEVLLLECDVSQAISSMRNYFITAIFRNGM